MNRKELTKGAAQLNAMAFFNAAPSNFSQLSFHGAACSGAPAMINSKVYLFLRAARRSVGPHLLIFFGATQRSPARRLVGP